jgi:hypothetical protein
MKVEGTDQATRAAVDELWTTHGKKGTPELPAQPDPCPECSNPLPPKSGKDFWLRPSDGAEVCKKCFERLLAAPRKPGRPRGSRTRKLLNETTATCEDTTPAQNHAGNQPAAPPRQRKPRPASAGPIEPAPLPEIFWQILDCHANDLRNAIDAKFVHLAKDAIGQLVRVAHLVAP